MGHVYILKNSKQTGGIAMSYQYLKGLLLTGEKADVKVVQKCLLNIF